MNALGRAKKNLDCCSYLEDKEKGAWSSVEPRNYFEVSRSLRLASIVLLKVAGYISVLVFLILSFFFGFEIMGHLQYMLYARGQLLVCYSAFCCSIFTPLNIYGLWLR